MLRNSPALVSPERKEGMLAFTMICSADGCVGGKYGWGELGCHHVVQFSNFREFARGQQRRGGARADI
jgi:hypothetical protein